MPCRLSMLLIVGLTLWNVGQAQDLPLVRNQFHKAVLDPENSREFYSFVNELPTSNATVEAYRAASQAMLAQVMWNPFAKLSQVNKYRKQMEKAVSKDSSNVEIRFLRFAVEFNLPRFLGMSTHLDEDRDIILANLSSVSAMQLDSNFSHYILYFLDQTGLCNEQEIDQIRTTLAETSDR